MKTKRRQLDWNAIANTIKEQEKGKKTYSNDDANEYKIKVKDDGTAQAIVRFLEPPKDEDLPFVKKYTHGWRDRTGSWFIENCPTTIGKSCPVCRENTRIWDEDEQLGQLRKRKPSFYANILVIKDFQTPENDGKVFKYRYGVKIHEKIMEKLAPENPEIDDMVPIFDYVNGANFKLKIKTVETTLRNGDKRKFLNYDSSSFDVQTPIVNVETSEPLNDDEINSLEGQLNPLAPIVDVSEFHSYKKLAEDFVKKTGIDVSTTPLGVAESAATVVKTVEVVETPAEKVVVQKTEKVPTSEDSDADFFQKLSQEE